MISGRGLERIGYQATIQGTNAFLRDNDRIIRGMFMTEKATASLAAKGSAGGLGVLATTATVIAAAFATAGGVITKFAADMETSLRMTQVITSATNVAIRGLSENIQSLGSRIPVSLAEIADGAKELAKAGISIKDIGDTAMEVAAQLAVASGGEIKAGEAALAIAVGVNAFKKSGATAVQVANAITGAAQTTTLSFGEMSRAFAQAAPSASNLGITVEDTAAAIGILGLRGLRGAEAGTALKQMFIKLQAPSKEDAKIMEQFNISLYDVNGNALPLIGIIGQLEKKFGDKAIALGELTPAMRDNALAELFEARAMRAAIPLVQEGVESFNNLREAMSRLNVADFAEAMSEPFNARLRIMLNNLNSFAINIGRIFLPAMKVAATAIGNLFDPDSSSMKALLNQLQQIGNAAKTLLTGIGFEQVQKQINEAFGPRTANTINTVFMGLMLLRNAVLGHIIPAFVDLANKIPGIFQVIGNALGSINLDGLLDTIDSVPWDAIIKTIAGAFTKAVSVIANIDWLAIGNIFVELFGIIDSLVTGFADQWSKHWPITAQVVNVVAESVGESVNDIIKSLGGLVESTEVNIGTFDEWREIADTVGRVLADVLQVAIMGISVVVDALANQLANLVRVLVFVANNGIKPLIEDFINAQKALWAFYNTLIGVVNAVANINIKMPTFGPAGPVQVLRTDDIHALNAAVVTSTQVWEDNTQAVAAANTESARQVAVITDINQVLTEYGDFITAGDDAVTNSVEGLRVWTQEHTGARGAINAGKEALDTLIESLKNTKTEFPELNNLLDRAALASADFGSGIRRVGQDLDDMEPHVQNFGDKASGAVKDFARELVDSLQDAITAMLKAYRDFQDRMRDLVQDRHDRIADAERDHANDIKKINDDLLRDIQQAQERAAIDLDIKRRREAFDEEMEHEEEAFREAMERSEFERKQQQTIDDTTKEANKNLQEDLADAAEDRTKADLDDEKKHAKTIADLNKDRVDRLAKFELDKQEILNSKIGSRAKAEKLRDLQARLDLDLKDLDDRQILADTELADAKKLNQEKYDNAVATAQKRHDDDIAAMNERLQRERDEFEHSKDIQKKEAAFRKAQQKKRNKFEEKLDDEAFKRRMDDMEKETKLRLKALDERLAEERRVIDRDFTKRREQLQKQLADQIQDIQNNFLKKAREILQQAGNNDLLPLIYELGAQIGLTMEDINEYMARAADSLVLDEILADLNATNDEIIDKYGEVEGALEDVNTAADDVVLAAGDMSEALIDATDPLTGDPGVLIDLDKIEQWADDASFDVDELAGDLREAADPISGDPNVLSDLDQIETGANEVSSDAVELVNDLNRIFEARDASAINSSMNNLASHITDSTRPVIQGLEADIESLDATIDAQEAQIAAQNQTITNLNTYISGLNAGIASLEQHIANLNTTIDNLDTAIDQRNNTINFLNGIISDLEADKASLDAQIASRTDTRNNLDWQISQRYQAIANLNEYIGELEARIRELEDYLAYLEGRSPIQIPIEFVIAGQLDEDFAPLHGIMHTGAQGVGGSVSNYNYNVNANYSRVQSPASVGMDLRAMIAMTRR